MRFGKHIGVNNYDSFSQWSICRIYRLAAVAVIEKEKQEAEMEMKRKRQ